MSQRVNVKWVVVWALGVATPVLAEGRQPLQPESPPSASEAASILGRTRTQLAAAGAPKDSLALLSEAQVLFAESAAAAKSGDSSKAQRLADEARAVTSLFLANYDEWVGAMLSEKMRPTHQHASFEYALGSDTRAVATEFHKLTLASATIVEEALKFAINHRGKGVIAGAMVYYSDRRNELLTESANEISDAVRRIGLKLKSSGPEGLRRFRQESAAFSARLESATFSVAGRLQAARAYADYFSAAARETEKTGLFPKTTPELARHLKRANELEASESLLHAWVNRSTVSAAFTAAVTIYTLGAYGVAAGAAGWAATGAEVSARAVVTTTLKQGVQAGVRATTAALATLNLADLVTAKGAGGLLSFDGALNILALMTALPRPGLTAMMNSKNALQLAQLQYQAGSLLLLMGGGYCIYTMAQADSLARRDQANGGTLTAVEVRGRSVAACAIVALGGLNHYSYYKQHISTSPELARLITYRTGVRDIMIRNWTAFKRAFVLPPTFDALRNISAIRAGLPFSPTRTATLPIPGARSTIGPWNQPPTPERALIGDVASIARGVVLALATRFAAYSTFDVADIKASGPLPDLEPGEIALVFNGFDTTDILYYGAEQSYFIRHELQKYERGRNLFYITAKSPEDLMNKVHIYSRQHGRVKYLRVAAHGLPGAVKFVSSDAAGLESKGVMDTSWLKKNAKAIGEMARDAFAENAQVRLYSCLVGGTLSRDARIPKADGTGELVIAKNAANEFIDVFGRTVLVNGGELHTSRRYLLGFDAIGGLLDEALQSGVRDPWKLGFGPETFEMTALLQSSPELRHIIDKSFVDLSRLTAVEHERLKVTHVSERLISMYRRIVAITQEVGLNVDTRAPGYIPPWSTQAHRIDRFRKQR